MPKIETSRLLLRMLSMQDLDEFALIFADSEVMKFIGIEAGTTLSRAETEDTLEKMIVFWTRNGFGRWAVIDKVDRKLVGLCGLRLLDGVPELFYLFAEASWGKGFATEAAAATLRYGFEELEFDRIIAVIRPGNTASITVVTKIGMSYEKEVSHYGVDGVRYAITRREFRPADSTYILCRG
ncbi:MAG: GNAT family N-acetyltransferase [Pyrinomonadaceae bacterium]|nr:GNAT family N-acetyltransferase [Pyrinomonadaceae bacterium]